MASILLPRDSEAASFNDDSSPDTRLTDKQKLAVNAQIVPASSLDWYFKILQMCESVRGELKSADVWPRFQDLRGEDRQCIWAGLSRVRIHIVDPRPYRDSVGQIVSKAFGCKDPEKFLSEQVALRNPRAVVLSTQLQLFIAERILEDSAAARVYSLGRFLSDDMMLFVRPPTRNPEGVLELEKFGPDVKPMVRKVSVWAAKSAATFHEALECFFEFDEEIRYSPNQIMRKKMATRILGGHAFDKGDQRQIDLLEDARTNILENLRGLDPRGRAQPKPYLQMDSRDAYLLQAADIAAGIASKTLETENLAAVVSRFEYVTYNGQRISVADAEEEMRLMRWRRGQ